MKNFSTLIIVFVLLCGFSLYPESLVKSFLTEFNVYSNVDHVKVTWTTKSRKEIDYFIIERSRDAKKFTPFRRVPDEGEDPKTVEFFEIDNTPLPGWSYYRIRQVLVNGDSAFSQVAPVFFGIDRISKGSFIAAKSPNDPPKKINLSQFKGQQVLLVVRDTRGAEYYVNEMLDVQANVLRVPASKQLPVGTYSITASSKDELLGLEISAQ